MLRTSGIVVTAICSSSFLLGQSSTAKSSIPQGDASQQGSGDIATQANDPSAPLTQIQFQDWFYPNYYGASAQRNLFIFRPILPVSPKGEFPLTIFRPQIPVVTNPNRRTGFGDIALTSVAFAVSTKKLRLGIGPDFVFPTASSRYVGQGKWQIGPSAILIYTGIKQLVIGSLLLNPISFAGQKTRADVNQLQYQPIIVKTFNKGYFVRFDPIVTFDWEHGGTATVPVNIGAGKIIKVGKRPVNVYLQPEWTVRRPQYLGAVTPKFTLRLSLTLLYPKGKQVAGNRKAKRESTLPEQFYDGESR